MLSNAEKQSRFRRRRDAEFALARQLVNHMEYLVSQGFNEWDYHKREEAMSPVVEVVKELTELKGSGDISDYGYTQAPN